MRWNSILARAGKLPVASLANVFGRRQRAQWCAASAHLAGMAVEGWEHFHQFLERLRSTSGVRA